MDNQQKQKILIGVLAVGALGAGSWFVFLREAPQRNDATTEDVVVARKARKNVAKTTSGRKSRAKKTRKTQDELSMGRKERTGAARKAASGRKKRGRGAKQVKKKKLTPAA